MVPALPNDFDPDAAAIGDGLFGLPNGPEDARIRILPVEFQATCSYRLNTADGPDAVLAASHQVDLDSPWCGQAWKVGLHLDEPPAELQAVVKAARTASDANEINHLSTARTQLVTEWTRARLAEQRVPAILGGDHSCPLGAITAVNAERPISILHVDAHHDLRPGYEGFPESHASIMHNVLEAAGSVERIVQIGIRDLCGQERQRAADDPRIRTHYWSDWTRRMFGGESFATLVGEALRELTDAVWISFDIDGLDPTLCPGTGTPVPGGLSFDQTMYLLDALRARSSQHDIVGFDLCEVGAGETDAIVGARVLYELCGTMTLAT
ncbi:MAG: hypothetical protein CMJ85_13110 [Planctomycetes bacterium]|jgi:agmatinase|nr:hypothetical protein [Planctomycetota bacterium]MDP6425021.1 arginase family protein [Planctomycetota bacterium]